MKSWERCTCTKEDAAAILAAAEVMYKKKYNKPPKNNTCTKEHAEIILDAAKIVYQKKYNKYSKSDKYKLREELDDDFEDFYDDLLNQIYDIDNDLANADDDFEQVMQDQINYFDILFRDT